LDLPAAAVVTRGTREIRVWDVPVRAVHWIQVALVAVSVATGFTGGNVLRWHRSSGYGLLALVSFRILWGFAGGRHARFSAFLRGPRAVVAFARDTVAGRPVVQAGHNPLAGWMVVVLLATLLVQATTGLFSNDDIAFEGPLAGRIAKEASDRLTDLHGAGARVLLGLVALHLAAVLFHLFVERRNLVVPMLTGRMRWPEGRAAPDPGRAPPWLATALFVLACTAVALAVNAASVVHTGGSP
jgi:cytochrome b